MDTARDLAAHLASPGTAISLRVPAARSVGLDELRAWGAMPPEGSRVLRSIVAKGLGS